jgi:DNA mismatch repair protein MutS
MSAPDLFLADGSKVTPMMGQYLAVKREHPDALVFYRMGDFYELFFDDALAASRALDIALTKRGQYQGQDVPMCGVPVHSHTAYVARLIRAGFRVAICEQTETPEEAKRRGSKSLVERKVVRIITPGTITEDTLLPARANNFLVALVAAGQGELALACCDLSTGQFEVESFTRQQLGAALGRLSPRELILPEGLAKAEDLQNALSDCSAALVPLPLVRFDASNCRARLLSFYGIATPDVWGELAVGELTAAGALIDYISLTQLQSRPALQPPRRQGQGERLEIDPATRRNLELTQTISGENNGSLLATIDRTVTAAGGRMLATRLAAPLTNVTAIAARHDSVSWALAQPAITGRIMEELKAAPDLERAAARLALGRGGPRDLAAVRESLRAAQRIYLALNLQQLPTELEAAAQHLQGHTALLDELGRALAEELPLLTRDGGFIAKGYAAQLDEQRTLRDEGKRMIAALQQRALAETGINTLKVKHNNIIGYHFEVSAAQADKLLAPPFNATYIHRQTMAGAVRFTTNELVALERDLAGAAQRAIALELELFEQLRTQILSCQSVVAATAQALAIFDVTVALASLAAEHNWCRPVVDDTLAFAVKSARHPVVEAALRAKAGTAFVANDCNLAANQQLWLLTGPNMAGKSTFLRQNALLVILAQMGSYVPAQSAHLGVADRLFSRVGAADDLARGRSTFMVEMVETATILNLATERSLVILDEIGRGTATYDGLSIAWAVVEHLHNVSRCRALFATHYHELTALREQLSHLYCASLRVKEWRGEVVFLHEVIAGAADRSYGLHVAKLAGLPAPVLSRAGELLKQLEARASSGSVSADLPLFGGRTCSAEQPEEAPLSASSAPSPLQQAVQELQPDQLSPLQALEVLYRLKTLA